MKKSIILTIALATLTLTACQDFLDVKPEGTPTTDTYFTNDAQAENAMKSLYSPMIDGDDCFGRDAVWEQCLGTQMVPGRTRDWPDLFCLKWNGDESPLRSVWNYLYKFQARANWIICALIEKSEKTELTYVENRTLGEAYFMRAFFADYVAYRYGTKDQGVPQVKYESFLPEHYDYSIPPQAASVCDNYQMIIDDLNTALDYLPSYKDYSESERGRACKEGAMALKARVYAHWATWDKSQWNNVITAVNDLESKTGRALLPSFSDNFNDEISTWWNSEYCWSVPSNGGYGDRVGAEFPGLVLENKGWGVYNGWGQCKPTYDAYEEFSKDGDRTVNERLARTILEYGVEFEYSGQTMKYYGAQDVETGFQINKWMKPFEHADFVNAGYVNEAGGSWPSARINYHVIRFADCMLLRAEANLANGNAAAAAKDLNAIRKRAGLAETCKGTWTELYHERYCELAYEPMADHGGDLRRWAVSGDPEIKALAIKELESHPRALFHVWRAWPDSPVGQGSDPKKNADGSDATIELGEVMQPTVMGDGKPAMLKGLDYQTITTQLEPGQPAGVAGYKDYVGNEGKWDDHLAVYPYPSQQIAKSAGKLKQNKGY